MSTREYCVYNETRENLLMPRVTVLDTRAEPLKAVKVLIEGLAPGSETGLWLNPLKSVPTIPRLSGYDLVYLDPQCRVLNAVALGADDDVPQIDGQTASALVLPIHTFSASRTHPGDKVVLHAADEIMSAGPGPHAAGTPVVENPVDPADDLRVACALAPLTAPLTGAAGREERTLSLMPEPELLPPVPAAKASPGISLLRSIVHLRIHISISVTMTDPAGVRTAPADPAMRPSAPAAGSLRDRVASLAVDCAGTMHSAATRTRGFLRERTLACAKACAVWQRRYARWAEVFVYGAPQVQSRAAMRNARRSPRLEEEC